MARVRLQGCLDVLSRGFNRHLDWFKGGILHKEPYVRVSKGDVSNLALHVLVVGELQFSWLLQLDRTSGLPGRTKVFDQKGTWSKGVPGGKVGHRPGALRNEQPFLTSPA